jgi:hypothetical protein
MAYPDMVDTRSSRGTILERLEDKIGADTGISQNQLFRFRTVVGIDVSLVNAGYSWQNPFLSAVCDFNQLLQLDYVDLMNRSGLPPHVFAAGVFRPVIGLDKKLVALTRMDFFYLYMISKQTLEYPNVFLSRAELSNLLYPKLNPKYDAKLRGTIGVGVSRLRKRVKEIGIRIADGSGEGGGYRVDYDL